MANYKRQEKAPKIRMTRARYDSEFFCESVNRLMDLFDTLEEYGGVLSFLTKFEKIIEIYKRVSIILFKKSLISYILVRAEYINYWRNMNYPIINLVESIVLLVVVILMPGWTRVKSNRIMK